MTAVAGAVLQPPITGSFDDAKAVYAARQYAGVDAFRYLLCFLVFGLHSFPNARAGDPVPLWVPFAEMLCRSAVPFFFIASGYFLSPERSSSLALVRKPLLRLLPVFIFWMAVYILYLTIYPVVPVQLHWRQLVAGGAAFHLWFLPALGIGLALVGLGVRIVGLRLTGIVCIGLAVLGLGLSSYHGVLGLAKESRGGTLIAPVFVYIGLCLSRTSISLRPTTALTLVLISYIALVVEEHALMHLNHVATLVSHDFTLSTFLLGASVFMLARSIKGNAQVEAVAKLGRISLGVYAAQMLFIWPLRDQIGLAGFVQVAAITGVAFLLSTLLAMAMRQSRITARFVG